MERTPSVEKYARSLIEHTFDLILLLDRTGTIIYASPSTKRLLGYDPDTVIGVSVFEFVHPEDAPRAAEFYRAGVDRQGFSAYLIIRARHRDGSWRWFEAVGNNLLEDPLVGGIVVSARDITEKRRLEEDLRRSEAYFRYITENTHDIISVMDREGKLRYLSPSIRRISGYEPEELLGRSPFELLHPEDMEGVIAMFREAVSADLPSATVEYRWRHKNGSWQVFEAFGINALNNPAVEGIIVHARDITQSKRLEAELHRSEEYYRSLVESTTDVITVLGADGRIRYVSPSVKRAAGYDPEELVGKSLFEFAHPDDIGDSARALAYAVSRKGTAEYAEIRIRHADGTWRYHEATANNLLEDPAIQGLVIHTRDITERKRWEEALRESEEKYRLIYDFTGEAIFTYDRDLVLIGVNRKACELIGYGERELLGKNVLELNILHPEDYERAAADIGRLLAGEVVKDELRFIRKDGSVAIGEVTGAPLYDRDGRVVAFTNVAHDVTDRKREEWRLDKLRLCLLGLGPDPMENIAMIVAVAGEVMGEGSLRYCRLDKGALAVLYPSGERVERLSPPDAAAFICYEAMLSGAVEPRVIEDLESLAQIRDPDVARKGFKSFLGYPALLRGKTVGMLCLFARESGGFAPTDMHFMGMLARALAIEEERLVHVESIRHFVDIASHELRTPLSIIKGYADAFQQGDLSGIDGVGLEKMRIINAKADKMAKTINDLLDLSRIERGLFTVHKQEAEVLPLLEGAVLQMREKGAAHAFEIGAEEGLGTHALDAEKISDALIILLDNAVKYSPPSEPILLEARRESDGLLLSVFDRGMGVPERDREIIFERFRQLEDAAHHSSGGLGLGLYIASEIARGHHGRIWCEAREGGGSVFRILIP